MRADSCDWTHAADAADRVTFLHDLPPALFATLTIAVFVGGALAGLVASRARVRARGLHALVDNNVIGWMFSAILVTCTRSRSD